MVLSGWLLCSVRCFICVLIMYSPLKQFVNMCAGLLGYSSLIIFRVGCIAINSTLKMLCRPSSLIASSMFLVKLMGQFEYVLEGFVSFKKLWLMYLFVQCFLCYYYHDIYIGSVW